VAPIAPRSPAQASANGAANHGQGVPELHPYLCHAFKIQDSVIYLSDVSWISEDSWAVLNQPSVSYPSHQYAVAIVDCLRPLAHISHYGIREAVNVARRINARRTYLTGFGHEVSHEEYATIGEYVGGKAVDNPTAKEKYCIDMIDEGKDIWLRPSHDGLRFKVSREGTVRDNSYDLGTRYCRVL
jgi:phosphoribosyl 1,2-cyclic phosphodiesterase